MFRLVFVLMMVFACTMAQAQSDDSTYLEVNAALIARNDSLVIKIPKQDPVTKPVIGPLKYNLINSILDNYNSDDWMAYYIVITITNKRDTAVSGWVATCSWPYGNFTTNNQRCYLVLNGCDHNSFEKVTLLPNQSAVFYGVLAAEKTLKDSVFSVGFRYRYTSNWLDYILENGVKKTFKPTCWSKPLKFETRLNQYDVR